MKLGILINTNKRAKEVLGLTKAATSMGHKVMLFMMDDGVKLLRNSALINLHKIPGVSMIFCQYSTHVLGISTDKLTKEVVAGSQFDNTVMNREVDRVIIL